MEEQHVNAYKNQIAFLEKRNTSLENINHLIVTMVVCFAIVSTIIRFVDEENRCENTRIDKQAK